MDGSKYGHGKILLKSDENISKFTDAILIDFLQEFLHSNDSKEV